ncbi:MAG: sensor histidine kinase [Cellulosilyticaceae bacterium]
MNEVLRLLLAVFEGFVLGSYMDLNLNLKSASYSKWFIAGAVGIMAVVNLVTNLLPYKMVLICTGMVLLGKLVYKSPWKQLILRMVVYYVLVFCVEISTITLFTEVFRLSSSQLQIAGIDLTLVGFVCTTLVMVITRTISKDNPIKKTTTWGYWTIIILSNVCIIILVFGIMTFQGISDIEATAFATSLVACTALAILNLFHCYTYVTLKEQYQKENEYALIRNAAEGQYKYLVENEKSFGVVRKVRHDLNNQMIGLDYLLEKERIEEARAYVQKISRALEEAEIRYITGYPIMDTIINQKYELCKLYDIPLNCQVSKVAKTNWSTQDICVVLGNAFDNAIEASKELPIDERKIVLELYERKGYVIIRITNAYKASDMRRQLATTKDKKWHGIGLKSIREIVAQYDGEVFIEADERTFCLKIVSPVDGSTKKNL